MGGGGNLKLIIDKENDNRQSKYSGNVWLRRMVKVGLN